MTESSDPSRTPALRASDADRERVVEVLRRAAGEGRLELDELDERLESAYQLRTVGELEALTRDVQVPPAPAGAGAGARGGVVVAPGPGGTRSVISIMGGHDRSGRWRVAVRCLVLSIMGGSDLDLNRAELSDQVTTMTVISIMGGSEIHVPRGVEVRVSKFALMGGNDVSLDDDPPPPGAPVIRIRMLSIMGGSNVRQGPRLSRAERRRERELRQERARELESDTDREPESDTE